MTCFSIISYYLSSLKALLLIIKHLRAFSVLPKYIWRHQKGRSHEGQTLQQETKSATTSVEGNTLTAIPIQSSRMIGEISKLTNLHIQCKVGERLSSSEELILQTQRNVRTMCKNDSLFSYSSRFKMMHFKDQFIRD